MRARDISSSSVKLYRSTAVLVDLPCCGHCSFSIGVKINKAHNNINQYLYYNGITIVVPDILSRLSCVLHKQQMHAPYLELLYLFDAPSSVANFHYLSRYSEWSQCGGTL